MPDPTPWDRLTVDGELEPMLWFRRFEAFRLNGPRRSILGVVNEEKVRKGRKETDSVSGSWREASEKWRWRERAEAWDAHVVEEDRRLWEERKEKTRQMEWDLSSSLSDKAAQMLKFPLARTVREEVNVEGQVIQKVTVEPMDWKPSDAANFAKTASQLARLAEGEPTEHVRYSLDDIINALPPGFRDAVRKALAGEISQE